MVEAAPQMWSKSFCDSVANNLGGAIRYSIWSHLYAIAVLVQTEQNGPSDFLTVYGQMVEYMPPLFTSNKSCAEMQQHFSGNSVCRPSAFLFYFRWLWPDGGDTHRVWHLKLKSFIPLRLRCTCLMLSLQTCGTEEKEERLFKSIFSCFVYGNILLVVLEKKGISETCCRSGAYPHWRVTTRSPHKL